VFPNRRQLKSVNTFHQPLHHRSPTLFLSHSLQHRELQSHSIKYFKSTSINSETLLPVEYNSCSYYISFHHALRQVSISSMVHCNLNLLTIHTHKCMQVVEHTSKEKRPYKESMKHYKIPFATTSSYILVPFGLDLTERSIWKTFHLE